MAGQLHTDTHYLRPLVQPFATVVLGPVNRARTLHLDIEEESTDVWVGEASDLIPGNGRLVNRTVGLEYELGPDKQLYAVTLGPFGAELYITVEERVNEGQFTDDGSGTEGPLGGGGDATAQPPEPDSTGAD